MSIYATLWKLKFPTEGDAYSGCDWIEVTAQGVPAHIGCSKPGCGYENGDPYAEFLPPPVGIHSDLKEPDWRAVVFITEFSIKGTKRNGQEYGSPLLVLSGEEYTGMTFSQIHSRLSDALRGNRNPVLAKVLLPDGSHKVIRG